MIIDNQSVNLIAVGSRVVIFQRGTMLGGSNTRDDSYLLWRGKEINVKSEAIENHWCFLSGTATDGCDGSLSWVEPSTGLYGVNIRA